MSPERPPSPDVIDAVLAQLRTARQVAELFGVTPQQLRRLAKKRGVGHRIGEFQLFTPADVEALTERRPGRPSQWELNGFAGESRTTHC